MDFFKDVVKRNLSDLGNNIVGGLNDLTKNPFDKKVDRITEAITPILKSAADLAEEKKKRDAVALRIQAEIDARRASPGIIGLIAAQNFRDNQVISGKDAMNLNNSILTKTTGQTILTGR